jgi:hypothetical protein
MMLPTALSAPAIIGYYSWNWSTGSTGPKGSNNGAAFTGYTDVTTAINYYTPGAAWCCPELVGTPWITLGGGNSAGFIDQSALEAIATSGQQIIDAGYKGVMFDVEEVEGSATQIVPAFATAFAELKKAGLLVGVTTSHSAPYATDTPEDAIAFVKAWVQDDNIDILSPQLYSSGQESSPEFDETATCVDQGCTWDLYKGCKAQFAPSIVDDSQFNEVQTYFEGPNGYGIPVAGFFQWAQVV